MEWLTQYRHYCLSSGETQYVSTEDSGWVWFTCSRALLAAGLCQTVICVALFMSHNWLHQMVFCHRSSAKRRCWLPFYIELSVGELSASNTVGHSAKVVVLFLRHGLPNHRVTWNCHLRSSVHMPQLATLRGM